MAGQEREEEKERDEEDKEEGKPEEAQKGTSESLVSRDRRGKKKIIMKC